MEHQLHAAAGVEEALEDDALLRRQRAEHGDRARQVLDDLARALRVEAGLFLSASTAAATPSPSIRAPTSRAQAGDRERELVAAPRGLAEPERNRRRRTLRILDPHPARLDAQDAVARVAELEDVAGDALDGEVLVDRADVARLRLEHDRVVAAFRDRAARGERRQPRALPSRRM